MNLGAELWRGLAHSSEAGGLGGLMIELLWPFGSCHLQRHLGNMGTFPGCWGFKETGSVPTFPVRGCFFCALLLMASGFLLPVCLVIHCMCYLHVLQEEHCWCGAVLPIPGSSPSP